MCQESFGILYLFYLSYDFCIFHMLLLLFCIMFLAKIGLDWASPTFSAALPVEELKPCQAFLIKMFEAPMISKSIVYARKLWKVKERTTLISSVFLHLDRPFNNRPSSPFRHLSELISICSCAGIQTQLPPFLWCFTHVLRVWKTEIESINIKPPQLWDKVSSSGSKDSSALEKLSKLRLLTWRVH